MANDPSTADDRDDGIERCYCIFEGGGARGLLHIGALQALQEAGREPGLQLRGFAGTSAGAIIAALASADYQAEELIVPLGQDIPDGGSRTILDDIELPPVPWLRLRRGFRPPPEPVRTVPRMIGIGWVWLLLLRAPTALWLVGPVMFATLIGLSATAPGLVGLAFGSPSSWTWVWLIWVQALSLAAVLGVAFGMVAMTAQGLVSLDRVRDGIDAALRRKIVGAEARGVTFADLDRYWQQKQQQALASGADVDAVFVPALKIVATDISNGKPQIFSSRTTPDRPIADAVVASIAIPVIFRPRRLEFTREWRWWYRWYVDGGVVSNLPAWVFDEERRLDPEAATALSSIKGRVATTRVTGVGFSPLRATVKTVLSAQPMLQNRGIDRMFTAPLDADKLGLLEFDAALDRVRAAINGAYNSAKLNLILPMLDDYALAQLFCGQVRDIAVKTLGRGLSAGQMRVAVFYPESFDSVGVPMMLHNRFNIGFRRSPDRFLRLPANDSFSGQAWLSGELVHGGPSALKMPGTAIAETLTGQYRALRALISPSMQWCLCIPIDLRSLPGGGYRGVEADGPPEHGRRRIVVAIDGSFGFSGDAGENVRRVNLVVRRIHAIFRPVPITAFGASGDPIDHDPETASVFANFFGANYLWP